MVSVFRLNNAWLPGPNPALPGRPVQWRPASHRAILEPVLEVLTAWLGPAHILAALGGDPLDQDLLQVGIILLFNLLLHLSAQAIRRSPVGHSEYLWWLWGAGQRTQAGLWSTKQYSACRDSHYILHCGSQGEKQNCCCWMQFLTDP